MNRMSTSIVGAALFGLLFVSFGCSLIVDGSGGDNDTPLLSVTGPDSVLEGQAYVLTVSATDPDGDRVSFSISDPPPGSTLDATTGVFNWTPPTDYVTELFGSATLTLTFSGTDDGSPGKTGTVDKTISVVNNDDGDTVMDVDDNCIFEANPEQVDYDGDGVGLACDTMIPIPNDLSLWEGRSDLAYGRYADVESRNGTTVFGVYNFDEDWDDGCPQKADRYLQENGLVIEAPETLTEIYGDLPTDGWDEGEEFVSRDGTGWVNLSDHLFRVSDGTLTSHYTPTPPNTEMSVWPMRDAPDGSTVLGTHSLYLDGPDCDEMGSLSSAYHWLGDTETAIFEDKDYIYNTDKGDAVYLLARDGDGTPRLATVNAGGITSYPLNATEASIKYLSGFTGTEYWLCTYNDGTGTATWQMYQAGAPVKSATLAFDEVTGCQDVYPLGIRTDDSTSSYVWTRMETMWMYKDVGGASTDYMLYRWTPEAGLATVTSYNGEVSGNAGEPYSGYLAGDDFYIFSRNSWAFWLNQSGDFQIRCKLDCTYSLAKYLSPTGTVTWADDLPSAPGYGVMELYKNRMGDPLEVEFPGPPTAPFLSSGWVAPNGVVWLNLQTGPSPYVYQLWAFDSGSLYYRTPSGGYSCTYQADESGNTLIGTSTNIYKVISTSTLDNLAATDGTSRFSVMRIPETAADDGFYWISYRTATGPSVYSLATWKNGEFILVRDDLTDNTPTDFTDLDGNAFIEYHDAAGWHIASLVGNTITPILSNLEANPQVHSYFIDGELTGKWVIYTLGGEMWAAPIADGTIGDPVLWSDDIIQDRGDALYVHMNPLPGGQDNRNTLCPYSTGGKRCSDAPVPDFGMEATPDEDTPGQLAGLVVDYGTEQMYLWRYFDALAPADCCEARAGEPGCSSTGISACVCAVNTACCKSEWSSSCVNSVTTDGCGRCDQPPAEE